VRLAFAKGLFEGAISESGGSFGHRALQERRARICACSWMPSDPVRSLENVELDQSQTSEKNRRKSCWPHARPVLAEYRRLGHSIRSVHDLRKQAIHDTPILVGYNSDEGASFSHDARRRIT